MRPSPSVSGDGVPQYVWDRVSVHYDRQLWFERAAVRAAVELLAGRGGERALDVGTGTGEVLRQLARGPARPGEVVGVDTSEAMLARVSQLPAGWSVQIGDARCLPFGAAEFDAATACYVLHVLADADVAAALAELRRVLRPGGRLVVVTPGIPARGPGRTLALALDRLAARHPNRYGGLRALDTRPALERAGFDIAKERWSLLGYPSICVLARRPGP
ncbi:MAG TPA: methyltransferase domain-containing protein [Solirubrobacteraceae bacterium]|nr:methyltransferase domain-containing protein [Solirubrobacteraceae bacterium]